MAVSHSFVIRGYFSLLRTCIWSTYPDAILLIPYFAKSPSAFVRSVKNLTYNLDSTTYLRLMISALWTFSLSLSLTRGWVGTAQVTLRKAGRPWQLPAMAGVTALCTGIPKGVLLDPPVPLPVWRRWRHCRATACPFPARLRLIRHRVRTETAHSLASSRRPVKRLIPLSFQWLGTTDDS